MFVGLGWSFDKPEASDASWRGAATGGVLMLAPPSPGKTLVSASSKRGDLLVSSILATTPGRGY